MARAIIELCYRVEFSAVVESSKVELSRVDSPLQVQHGK